MAASEAPGGGYRLLGAGPGSAAAAALERVAGERPPAAGADGSSYPREQLSAWWGAVRPRKMTPEAAVQELAADPRPTPEKLVGHTKVVLGGRAGTGPALQSARGLFDLAAERITTAATPEAARMWRLPA